jgi:two-component system, cell cycle response regulator DivK
MPILDGLACAREIRASDNPLVKDMPIIAITGNAFNYSIEDFHNAGINDYLPKPLNYDHMVELVKKYLEK